MIRRNLWLMLLLAFTMAVIVFLLTRQNKDQFYSETLIDTGMVAGYDIENAGSGQRVDREFMRNEMESLISLAKAYETMEELSTWLLARYIMVSEPSAGWIGAESFRAFQESFPAELRRELIYPDSLEGTYQNLVALRDAKQNNPVSQIIYSDHHFFGLEQLRNTIRVDREGNSDLLKLSYVTSDPAVCQQTLIALTDLLTQKVREQRRSQSSSVLSYFEEATQQAAFRLRNAEDKLLEFHEENNVINYYEQTRFIANKKEDLDEMFFKERMELRSSKAKLARLEDQLRNRVRLSEINNELMAKRSELTDISRDLAKYELVAKGNPETSVQPEVQVLQDRHRELRKALGDVALEKYQVEYSPEGMDTKNMLDEWLKIVINSEESGARLEAIDERRNEFEEIYKKFAPWGSRLKRIEREIDLAENAYLENLHSYNQARLHMQNTLMSASLQLVDAPFYPVEPLPSKRLILIAIAFIAGLLLTLGVILGLEFLDHSLKRPAAAARATGLELFGALPRRPEKIKGGILPVDAEYARSRSVELLLQQIKLHTQHVSGRPRKVVITSTREGEGKSLAAGEAGAKLRAYGRRVLYLFPQGENTAERHLHPDDRSYALDAAFPGKESIAELFESNHADVQLEDYDYVFVEIPGLLTGQYPIDLVAEADLSLLICRANRVWNAADRKAIDTYHKAIEGEAKLVMNGVPAEYLEDSLGELPRRRSSLQRWFKRMATLNFAGKARW